MPDLLNVSPSPIGQLLKKIDRYKHNPSNIQRSILDYLKSATLGQVDLVDPTNPFVFLLEASAVNTSVAINESMIHLRKQYPALAQTEDDLYRHMSDKDYLKRFSTPASGKFIVLVQYRQLLGSLVLDQVTKTRKVTIARNTEVEINGLVFSLQYPIDVRQYPSGAIEVAYDARIPSPLYSLETNIIPHTVEVDQNNVEWIRFEVLLHQFRIETTYHPLQASMTFRKDIPFTDQYWTCRVYYKNQKTYDRWIEIETTHTDQVFDPFRPTAVLKVTANQLNVYIPQLYINSNRIGGNARVDIYTTKGAIQVNMSNYQASAFTTTFKAVDHSQDTTVFTQAFNELFYLFYTDQVVHGGSQGLEFNQLRELVIQNAIGPYQVPITDVQLAATEYTSGFKLIKNVDLVTNRIYLASKELPPPTHPRLITPATVTIGTYITNLDELRHSMNVNDHGARLTLKGESVFKEQNGKISLVTDGEVQLLKQSAPAKIAETINSATYLFTPFHYVLDNSLTEFEMRGYELNRPEIVATSFVGQNTTTQYTINTQYSTVELVPEGYRLTLWMNSNTMFGQLDERDVFFQLAFRPIGESHDAYLNGTIESHRDTQWRVSFLIETGLDINSKDELILDGFKMYVNEKATTRCQLTTQFHCYACSRDWTNGFMPSPMDDQIGKFLLPLGVGVVTQETFTVRMGTPLKQLWSRCRSVLEAGRYATYQEDVPKRYASDIYEVDPVTGSIFTIDEDGEIQFNLLHERGDIATHPDGETIYDHRQGDLIRDEQGNPIKIDDHTVARHLDLLLVEGLYQFATGRHYIDYRQEVADTIKRWITEDLERSNDKLLEQTKIYYYPQKRIGLVDVKIREDHVVQIPAEQKFSVELYVPRRVYHDIRLRETLEFNTIQQLNHLIKMKTLSVSDIVMRLRVLYQENVISAKLTGLGDKNYETVTLINPSDALSLHKKLIVREDQSLAVVEDVSIQFIEYLD